MYYWDHNSRLLLFSQKVSFQWNPAEKIYMPREWNIFHLYRHGNWICFTQNLSFIAAVINFKGSRIHFSNEIITILLPKSLNMSPKKTLHSTFSTIILRIWFSWYEKQRNFTLPEINTPLPFRDLSLAFQGTVIKRCSFHLQIYEAK